MIISLSTAEDNAFEIRKILKRHPEQFVNIVLCNYIARQGKIGYSGEFKDSIRELAIQACKNKQQEISKIIREGIFEILDNDCGIL